MKRIVCLILILYITNVYSFEIKPTCVDSDLCDKIEKEINVVDCWISDKYHNKIELECSSPFKEDSDYKVKEYKFVKNKINSFAIEYHFTPSLNYEKYMSKYNAEQCEKTGYIQLPASSKPPTWANTSCHTYFNYLKKEHNNDGCMKAWKAWNQMTTKGYLTEEHRNGNFLEMVKEQFHDNLVAVHTYAFEFQFDELSHNLLCIPEDDDEPLCHSLFKLCNEDQEKGEYQWKDIKPNGIHTTGHEWYDQESPDYDFFSSAPIHVRSTSDVKESQEETKYTKRGINLSPHWTASEEDNPNDGRIFKCSSDCEEEKEKKKSTCVDYCSEKNSHPEARLLCSAFCDSTTDEEKSCDRDGLASPCHTGDLCNSNDVKKIDEYHTCYHDDFCSGSEDCYVNGKHEQQKEKQSNDDHPGFLKAADGTIGNYCKFEYPSYQPLSCWNVSHATPGQGHDAWSVGDIFSSKTPSHNDFTFDLFYLIMFAIGVVISSVILRFFFSSFNYLIIWCIRIHAIIEHVLYNTYIRIRSIFRDIYYCIFAHGHVLQHQYEQRIEQLTDLINDILSQQTECESPTPDKETK